MGRPCLGKTVADGTLGELSGSNFLYYVKNRDEAHRRLDHAGHELAKLGPLPQLRRRGRHDKATLLERINRFEDDVRDAERKVSRCEQNPRR